MELCLSILCVGIWLFENGWKRKICNRLTVLSMYVKSGWLVYWLRGTCSCLQVERIWIHPHRPRARRISRATYAQACSYVKHKHIFTCIKIRKLKRLIVWRPLRNCHLQWSNFFFQFPYAMHSCCCYLFFFWIHVSTITWGWSTYRNICTYCGTLGAKSLTAHDRRMVCSSAAVLSA